MKNVVIDTSAWIAVIANEPEKSKLVSLTSGCSLIAPRSVYWGIGNAFSAMIRRESAIKAALQVLDQIPVRYVEVGLSESLDIAKQYNIYAYDAYLLASAWRYQSPLLSLDQQLVRLGHAMGISIWEV